MHLKYKDGTTGHVANDTGRALIAANLATEIVSQTPKPIPNSTFVVRDGQFIGDHQHPPYIHVRCATCGQFCVAEGPTVAATFRFAHCGIQETVPAHVAREHDRARAAYLSRRPAKKQKLETPTQKAEREYNAKFTSPAVNRNFGIKTREQLIAEAPRPVVRQK